MQDRMATTHGAKTTAALSCDPAASGSPLSAVSPQLREAAVSTCVPLCSAAQTPSRQGAQVTVGLT